MQETWAPLSWLGGSWERDSWGTEPDERIRGGTTSTHRKKRRKPEAWDWPEQEQRRLYVDTALPTMTRVPLDTQDSDEDDLLALLLTGII